MKIRVRIRSRIPSGERGVTTVLVAIFVVVLFGFTALAVDVARLYEERRELQRTADVSALSGGQKLVGLDDAVRSATAKATAIEYINYDENRSVHHDDYFEDCSGAGDCVTVRLSDTSCDPEGLVAYDCITSHVAAPEFDFLLAPVLGFTEPLSIANGNPVRADATVVLGSGAPGGEKLVPWMVLDCPDYDGNQYPEESDARVIEEAFLVNPSCPYLFSDDLGWEGPRVTLFSDVSSGGNFHGANLNPEPDCPPAYGWFDGGSGGSNYEEMLAGAASPEVPCNIAKGARVHTKTGQMTGPTKQGLLARDVTPCMNQTSFDSAIDLGEIGDNLVSIIDPSNPCIVALILVVNPDPFNTQLKQQIRADIPTWQHKEYYDGAVADGENDSKEPDGTWRFGPVKGGTSVPYIVRRFAFFYITDEITPGKSYQGLFLHAFDSADAILDGAYDPDSGIHVIKLID